jgi:hypothetical protein
MSLYISSENQSILWNAISKSTIFQQSVPNKEHWFKAVIGHFYDEVQDTTIDKLALKDMNRRTIIYMLDELAKMNEISNRVEVEPKQRSGQLIQIYEGPSREPKTPISLVEQDNYENMYKLKPPAEIDFKEPLLDEPIANMDELIKSHIQERELELAKYTPQPPIKIESIETDV